MTSNLFQKNESFLAIDMNFIVSVTFHLSTCISKIRFHVLTKMKDCGSTV